MANQNLVNLSLEVRATCPLCFKVYDNHPDKRVNMDNLKNHMLSPKSHPETKNSAFQKIKVKTHSKASLKLKACSLVNIVKKINALSAKKCFV